MKVTNAGRQITVKVAADGDGLVSCRQRVVGAGRGSDGADAGAVGCPG